MTPDRLLLEQNLIGRAITCIPSAITISDVLSPSNFQNKFCGQVFALILEGIDTMEIDLMSITRKFFKRHGEQKGFALTELADRAMLTSHVLSDALILLEMDMKEKFGALLTRMERECAAASDFEAAAVWKQCADHLAHKDNDVFVAVDHLHSYLTSCFPDQMDEYNQLRSAIPKMVDRIRKRANARKFIESLTAMVEDGQSHERRMTIKILTDWLILATGNMKLPDNFYSTISTLNSTWNA
jgi:hypothetical protein